MDKVKLITAFLDALFKSEANRIEQSIERLDRENRDIRGSADWGFMWQGQRFVPKTSPYKVIKVPALHFDLRKSGDFLLKDIKQVDDDKQMISQIMHLLIIDCEDEQDLRDALPESLVELSSKLQTLPRTREAGYTIRSNERSVRQFQKMLDKIDFYAATRLMY